MFTLTKQLIITLLCSCPIVCFAQTTKIIQGQVLDSNSEPISGAIIKPNKSRNTATTDEKGMFLITVTDKDKEIRMIMNGETILKQPISKSNVIFSLDISNDPSVVGYMKGDTYYPGSADLSWETIITSRFTGVKYNKTDNTLSINRFNINSPSTSSDGTCKYYEVDGSTVPSLSSVELPSVHSIRIIKDMAESLLYGAEGQFGAVIIVTKGMEKKD